VVELGRKVTFTLNPPEIVKDLDINLKVMTNPSDSTTTIKITEIN